MAYIRKRDGRFQVLVRVNGRERSAGTFGRKIDADRAKRAVEDARDRNTRFDPRAGDVRLDEWVRVWLDTKHDVKPKTLDGYEGILRSRVVPALGDYPLNRIDAEVVDSWVAAMIGEGLSPSRIRQSHHVLSAALKLAVRRNVISSNPCEGTILPAAVGREQRFLTPDELAAVAGAMPLHLRAATWTLGLAGLRFGEMAALERDDIDVLHRRIDVSKAVTEINGRLHLGETKNRKTRSVAIPERLATTINDHLITHDTQIAFPDSAGGYLRVSNFRGRVLKACRTAGVEPIRTHDLRHTAAALMLSVEPDLHLVMRQLGHSSITVTVDCYGHLLPGRLDQVAEKMDAMLDEAFEASGNVVSIRRDADILQT